MIALVRRLTILPVAVSFAIIAATSSGGTSSGRTYSPRDLPAIVDSKPTLPKWSFEQGDPYIFPIPAHAPAFTLAEFLGESPTKAQKALAVKLRKASFQIGRHNVWIGSNEKIRGHASAVVYAFLFRTTSGARAGFRALRLAGGAPAKGLGQESLALHAKDGDEVVLYQWRRSNLVVDADFDCDGECGFPPVPLGRAYATQIDARAKRTP
jgi:hypothetical protein